MFTAMAASGNEIVPRLLEHSLFVSEWFTVLCNHLSLVYSLGANSPPTGFLSAAALGHLKSDESTPSMWFKWINAPQFQDSCVQIQQIDAGQSLQVVLKRSRVCSIYALVNAVLLPAGKYVRFMALILAW